MLQVNRIATLTDNRFGIKVSNCRYRSNITMNDRFLLGTGARILIELRLFIHKICL